MYLFKEKLFILLCSLFAFSSIFAEPNIYQLRRHISLGDVKMHVTTKNQTAREHFLLGTAFLHTFMYDLAIQEFQQAQKLDPGFAMSYWGEAMAYKHPIWNYENVAAAQAVLNKFEKNKDGRALTQTELNYMQAVTLLFSKASQKKRDQAYLIAMQNFQQQFPHDPNAAAFYALAKLGFASDFPQDKHSADEISQGRKLINQLIKQFPNHPGIVHYYLHYHDSANQSLAREALPAAKKALALMTDSSHVTHMAAHIYRRLAMTDDYILANKISIDASNKLCKVFNKQPLYACDAENKYHSLEWLHDGYLIKKQYERADKLVKQMRIVTELSPSVLYKQWYYRMWGRQILFSKNWKMKAITVHPITQKNDQLYWSAYSECAALQGLIFLNLHQHQPIQASLNRLNSVIAQANILSDPYIKRACEIAKLEILSEEARLKKNMHAAKKNIQIARKLQDQQISTELTPSLSILPLHSYESDYV